MKVAVPDLFFRIVVKEFGPLYMTDARFLAFELKSRGMRVFLSARYA